MFIINIFLHPQGCHFFWKCGKQGKVREFNFIYKREDNVEDSF